MSIGVLITSEEHLDNINNVIKILESVIDHPNSLADIDKDLAVSLMEWFDSIKFILTQLPNHSIEDSSYINSLVS
jgi:hypothetical protein